MNVVMVAYPDHRLVPGAMGRDRKRRENMGRDRKRREGDGRRWEGTGRDGKGREGMEQWALCDLLLPEPIQREQACHKRVRWIGNREEPAGRGHEGKR